MLDVIRIFFGEIAGHEPEGNESDNGKNGDQSGPAGGRDARIDGYVGILVVHRAYLFWWLMV